MTAFVPFTPKEVAGLVRIAAEGRPFYEIIAKRAGIEPVDVAALVAKGLADVHDRKKRRAEARLRAWGKARDRLWQKHHRRMVDASWAEFGAAT